MSTAPFLSFPRTRGKGRCFQRVLHSLPRNAGEGWGGGAFWRCAAMLLIATSALADGPVGYQPRVTPAPTATAAQAVDPYHAGYAAVLQADHMSQLAAASGSAERKAHEREAQRLYAESLKHFDAALKLEPSIVEAWTYVGYAHRRLGRYDASLHAYEQALRLDPAYPEAMEYQAQAFIALNRIDDAKRSYLRLYALDSTQAARVLAGLKSWAETHASKPPADVDVRALNDWIAQRSSPSNPAP